MTSPAQVGTCATLLPRESRETVTNWDMGKEPYKAYSGHRPCANLCHLAPRHGWRKRFNRPLNRRRHPRRQSRANRPTDSRARRLGTPAARPRSS